MPIGGELNDSNSKNEGMVVSQQQNMTGKKKEHLPQQQQKQTWRAGMFMIALAIQYGVQPLISKRCTGYVRRSTDIMECRSFLGFCFSLLFSAEFVFFCFCCCWGFLIFI